MGREAAHNLHSCCGRRGREVERVAEIAGDPERWSEAHGAFDAVQRRTLEAVAADRHDPAMLLYAAENVAKLTYNASGAPAPFDEDAPWFLLMNLSDFLNSGVPGAAGLERRLGDAIGG